MAGSSSGKGCGIVSSAKRGLGSFIQLLIGEGQGTVHISTTCARHSEWVQNAVMNKERGFGHFLVSHTLGVMPGMGAKIKSSLRIASNIGEGTKGERRTNVLTIGGALGAVGYMGGWVMGIINGAKHGNAGKRQFEQAQTEIKHLHESNDDLEKINDRLHAEVVEASTKHKARADSAPNADLALAANIAAAHIPTTTTQSAIEHHGMVHGAQPEVGAAVGG